MELIERALEFETRKTSYKTTNELLSPLIGSFLVLGKLHVIESTR